jgi:signal transduction histidine kinase
MRLSLIWILLPLLTLLEGCSVLQGGKLFAPETFGLVQIASNIYVEPGTDQATQASLREAMQKAEIAIRTAYGSARSQPIVHACISERCLESFGGRGTLAKVYGNRILLSSRALNWHFIAHEWSHAEMSTRLTFPAWRRMPQWFDDGVAVAISEAPEHSEQHWQFLVRSDILRPTPDELRALKSLDQWLNAVRHYGDNKNAERRARGETEIHSLYAAAGHELRPWLAAAGTSGLLSFVERMNNGEAFESALQTPNLSTDRLK